MSKRTYINSPSGATEGWTVLSGDENIRQREGRDKIALDSEKFYICIEEPEPCDCGCENCRGTGRMIHRLHDSHQTGRWEGFGDHSDAVDTIEAVQEDLDNDYDDYREENRYEILQQERMEQWRNEY